MKVGRGRGGECAGTDIIERVYLPIWSRILKYFRSWGKVMFLHVSVILFTGGWCLPQLHAGIHPPPSRKTPGRPSPPRNTPGRHPLPQEDTRKTPPQEDPPPRSSACWEIRATSGWYSSYWNAYLLNIHLKCRLRVNPK